MHHIMLDLETIATTSNAGIVSIGACRFDDTGIKDDFYAVVKAIDVQQEGFDVDVGTLLWWMGQSKEAQEAWTKPNGTALTLTQALHAFSKWVQEVPEKPCVWGNGSDFDCVVLGNAYAKLRIGRPWSYAKNRCYRTMKNFCPNIKLERVGTYHNALDDAKSQAEHLIRIWEFLDGTKG